MRAAADGEDASIKNVAMENRLFPMREPSDSVNRP